MLCKIVKYLVLLSLFSCSYQSEEMRFDNERHKITHDVPRDFTKAMRAKGLYAAGIGEGLDHSSGKQNFLKVFFEIDELPNIHFARLIIVETIQEFLNLINSKEGIQDYLAEYPFPLRYVCIGIVSRAEGEGIFLVSNFQEEELTYCKHDANNPNPHPLIDVHKETFADSVRILAQQEIKDSKTYVMQNH